MIYRYIAIESNLNSSFAEIFRLDVANKPLHTRYDDNSKTNKKGANVLLRVTMALVQL